MADNEIFDPLASEAGQDRIVRAINNISSLEYAVRAEQAATQAAQSKDEAAQSAQNAQDSANRAEQAAGSIVVDTAITENGANPVTGGAIYTALSGKADSTNVYTKTDVYTKTETDSAINTRLAELVASAPATLDTLDELANALGDDPNFATTIATQLGNKADKSTTYTKTEVDTLLADKADSDDVQTLLTFDDTPTANSNNPVKSGGIKTALDGKQDSLTFDSTPTQNSTNPVTSGGVYNALQNVDIDVDTEITETSNNPVTSAAIYAALQNIPSGGGSGEGGGVTIETIYSNNNGWSSGQITLDKSWKNYDFLYFVFSKSNEGMSSSNSFINNDIISTSSIKENQSLRYNLNGYGSRYFLLKFDNDTQITMLQQSETSVWQIKGIKFGRYVSGVTVDTTVTQNSNAVVTSGAVYDALQNIPSGGGSGGGSSYSIDSLFAYSSITIPPTNTDIVFTHPWSDYDLIIFRFGGANKKDFVVSKKTMEEANGTSNKIWFNIYNGQWYYSSIIVVDLTTIQFNTSNYSLTEIIGIKCGESSSSGQGMTETVLFESANGVNSGTITLSGNISDYDMLDFQIRTSDSSRSWTSHQILSSFLTNMRESNHRVVVSRWNADYIDFYIQSDSSILINSSQGTYIYRIVGIKFSRSN